MLSRFREPALAATSLLAPLAATILLFAGGLSAEAQAAWNAVAVATAGLITSVIAVRDRLVPTILGFAQSVLAVLTVHGWGLSAERATGVMAFVALAVGAYVRTQVGAPPAAGGRHAAP